MDIAELGALKTKATCDVTVVIPTYNRKDLCVRAIQSVFSQTLVPAQVVVVDDGSKDGTEQALREKFGDRVLVIVQKNAGVSAARNIGVKNAAGKYVAFLDSDDQWLDRKVELQYGWLMANPGQDAVVCDYNWVTSDGKHLKRESRSNHFNATGEVLDKVLEHPYLLPSTLMISRELFLATKGFDSGLKTAEDVDLFLKIALVGKVGLVPEPLVDYVATGSERLSESAGSTGDHVFVVERFVKNNRDALTEVQTKTALLNVYLSNSLSAAGDERFLEAGGYLLKASRHLGSAGSLSRLLKCTRNVLKRFVVVRLQSLRSELKSRN
jgi:glycosyltransferase involved in cell wall biosynthesis